MVSAVIASDCHESSRGADHGAVFSRTLQPARPCVPAGTPGHHRGPVRRCPRGDRTQQAVGRAACHQRRERRQAPFGRKALQQRQVHAVQSDMQYLLRSPIPRNRHASLHSVAADFISAALVRKSYAHWPPPGCIPFGLPGNRLPSRCDCLDRTTGRLRRIPVRCWRASRLAMRSASSATSTGRSPCVRWKRLGLIYWQWSGETERLLSEKLVNASQ